MLDFFKSKDKTVKEEQKKPSFFSRLKQGLSKTRAKFSAGVANLLLGKKTIDQALLEELETLLLMADVGTDTTDKLLNNLTQALARKDLDDPNVLYNTLKEQMINCLKKVEQPLALPEKQPTVILMIGVNGSGKTTTIGKLAKQFSEQGKKVMLAAGDTFRAAAIEQLKTWGERNDVPVIAQQQGSDSASVIFDAIQAAKARNIDVLLADTAGRLHTQDNLMAELQKVIRVIKKIDETAPHEIMLVLDAGIGQNALVQAEQFKKECAVTGLTITKLDGSAKAGVIFALANKIEIPVRFIGLGEGIDDLKPFAAEPFVDALLTKD